MLLAGCRVRDKLDEYRAIDTSHQESKEAHLSKQEQEAIKEEQEVMANHATLALTGDRYQKMMNKLGEVDIESHELNGGKQKEYVMLYKTAAITETLVTEFPSDEVIAYHLYVKKVNKISSWLSPRTNFERALTIVGGFMQDAGLIDRPLEFLVDTAKLDPHERKEIKINDKCTLNLVPQENNELLITLLLH